MDISTSLENCKTILRCLEQFPKCKRNPIEKEFYPKKKLEEAHKEMLEKCIPFLNKMVKDIKNQETSIDFTALEARRQFIKNKLEESKKNIETDLKRSELLIKIEKLESLQLEKIEKIVLDEARTLEIIEYLFEHNVEDITHCTSIEKIIELTYDKEAINKVGLYEKILKNFEENL